MIRLLSIMYILIIWSASVFAQSTESELIYSGLEDATSIYATQDYLFVVESGINRLLKLDHDGNLIETLGGFGNGDYQFDRPIDVDATNGLKIYVSDYGNNRVQIYDRRFQYLGTITGESAFQNRRIQPTQLVVNDFGELFVYDEASKSILKFDENGNQIGSFEPGTLVPTDLEIIRNQIQVEDQVSGQMVLMSQNGLAGDIFPFTLENSEGIDEVTIGAVKFILRLNQVKKSTVNH